MKKAGPATAVEILGLTEVPEAGDEFNAVSSDKVAREIAEQQKAQTERSRSCRRAPALRWNSSSVRLKRAIVKELNLIVKADVQGSVGALVIFT